MQYERVILRLFNLDSAFISSRHKTHHFLGKQVLHAFCRHSLRTDVAFQVKDDLFQDHVVLCPAKFVVTNSYWFLVVRPDEFFFRSDRYFLARADTSLNKFRSCYTYGFDADAHLDPGFGRQVPSLDEDQPGLFVTLLSRLVLDPKIEGEKGIHHSADE